jgi:tellurite resistance protein
MTPAERNIVKSLIAVAWADGQMESSEASVVEGLLVGFDATEEEENELLEWAKTPRSLDKDIPLDELTDEDRELLLANAALLTMADGKQTDDETKALGQLVAILKIDVKEAKTIIAGAADGALSLSSRSLT